MVRKCRRYAGLLVLGAPLLAGTAEAQNALPPPSQSTQPAEILNVSEMRDLLGGILMQYPPSLAEALRTDNSLLTNEEFLQPYPKLSLFLSQHPEVIRNPAYFVGVRNQTSPFQAPDPGRMAEAILIPVMVGLVFMTLIGALTVTANSVIAHRRWTRISKVQHETSSKLLDRFSASADLLAYLQTPTGRRLIESAPASMEPGMRAGAPVSRILWSVQIGLVLAFGGFGMQFVSTRIENDVAQAFFVLGVLGIALGLGFMASALASYLISWRMGLLEHPLRQEATPPT